MKTLPNCPIGCWQVPATDIAKWQGRQVNLLVGAPSGQDLLAWAAAAVSQARPARTGKIRFTIARAPLRRIGCPPA